MSRLQQLETAERALALVATTEDALKMIDLAEAARVYAKQAKLGTSSINHATTIKLKAERRLADLVDEGQAAGQIASQSGHGIGRPKGLRTAEAFPLLDVPTKPAPATLDDIGVSYQRLHEARKIRDNYTDDDIDTIAAQATAADDTIARTEFIQRKAHVANNTGEHEWYTPAEFIEAAREVFWSDLGDETEEPITLDPASSSKANETVQAQRYFTKDDNGLEQRWDGTVWMNPPYSHPLIGQFVSKLLAELSAGNIVSTIVLVNNGTETTWGQNLIARSEAVCFPAKRIKFIDAAGNNSGAPLQGQMIVYLRGDGTRRKVLELADEYITPAGVFVEEFSRFGAVLING